MNNTIYPENYSSGITKEQWISMINNPKIFNNNSKIVMKCFLETGLATCKELEIKYGRTFGFYNMVSSLLGKRIHKFTSCPLCGEDCCKYWPILYKGCFVGKDRDGEFAWKLVDELKEALLECDLSYINTYEK